VPNLKGPISVADFRANLSDAVGTVKYGGLGSHLVIARKGKPCTSIVSIETAAMLTQIVNLAKAGRHTEIGNFVATLIPTKT